MYEVTEIIDNPWSEPVEVWFEPWGMPHTLDPGRSFRVVAASDEADRGRLEIDREDGYVAVYGWPGCTIRVYLGNELVDDLNIKFPREAFPPGMTAKSFVGFMFGGPGGPGAVPDAASMRSPTLVDRIRRLFKFVTRRDRVVR